MGEIYSDGMTEDDKRRLKRRHLIYYLPVYDRKTDNLIGHVVDLTSDGIMTIHENPVEIDVDFQLRMNLPAEMGEKMSISFDARSLWSLQDANPDFYSTGFKITEIDWQGQEAIERLINNYGFND
jgi:hypothetical protein